MKYLIARRIFRTLKNWIFKIVTTISQNMYTETLCVIASNYNDTYNSTKIRKPSELIYDIYVTLYLWC